MPRTPYRLLADRGDHEDIRITVTRTNLLTGEEDPVDITNCTLWWGVATSTVPNARRLVAKDSDGVGITIDDAVGGLATVHLEPADTSSLPPSVLNRDLPWEVQLEDAAGERRTVGRGLIVFRSDIIRA